MPTTKDTPFFSKSNSVGSSRWKALVVRPGYVAGYLIDGAFQKLASRWYIVWLEKDSEGKHWICASLVGNAEEFDLSVASFTAALEQNPPVLRVATNLDNELVAVERFNRVVSNIMHGLLEPSPAVLFLWERLATSEDGSNVYSTRGKGS